MKRIVLIITIVFTVLFLCACSNENFNNNSNTHRSPPNYVSYLNYDEFINGAAKIIYQDNESKIKKDVLSKKYIIFPKINKDDYECVDYSIGFRDKYFISYTFYSKDPAIKRSSTDYSIGFYIDYDDESPLIEKSIDNWEKRGRIETISGKISYKTGEYNNKKYAVREFIPEKINEDTGSIPGCTVDMIIDGHRVSIFFSNSFKEEFLDMIEFIEIDLSKEIEEELAKISSN